MALYHSAKGTAGYTVIGAPTITDGVISGFSGNDYVSFNQQFFFGNTDYEIVIRALISINDYNPLFGCSNNDNRIFLTSGNISYSFNSLGISGTKQVSLTFNQYYYIRVKKEGNTVKIGYSSDNKTYDEDTVTATQNLTNYSILQLGHCTYSLGTSAGLFGSIDLNNTYITSNGQPWFGVCPIEVKKHQLIGPVGYTKVGNPTIVDGVARDFSVNNYLTINGQQQTNFEICVPFTTSSIITQQQILWGQSETAGVQILSNGSMKFSLDSIHNEGTEAILSYILSPQTKYKFVAIKNNDNTMSLSLYNEANELLDSASATSYYSTSSIDSILGLNAGTPYYFTGSVDLNNTYIKVNDKLLFYQPAPAKYIVKDGKLVWADPKIYLRSSTASNGITCADTINTHYTYNLKFRYNQDYPLGYSNRMCPIGRWNSPADSQFGVEYVTPNSGSRFIRDLQEYFPGVTHSYITDPYGPIELKTTISNGYKSVYFKNGSSTYQDISTSQAPNNSVEGFALFSKLGDFTASGDIYFIKLFNENGVLVRHLVPVPAGMVIGNITVDANRMFDIVTQTLFGSVEGGDFTIGRDE